jgi:hypothetical protein
VLIDEREDSKKRAGIKLLVQANGDRLGFDLVSFASFDHQTEAHAFSALEAGGNAIVIDESLDGHDAFDELFWARWAAWHVDIDGYELVDALDDGICVKDASG